MFICLVKNAALWLNAFPQLDRVSTEHSPYYLLTRYELSYDTHAVLEFGADVQTHEITVMTCHIEPWGVTCLGPTDNHQDGHCFRALTSGAQITRHHWTPLPMPCEAIDQIYHIGCCQGIPTTIIYANCHGNEVQDGLDKVEDGILLP